MYTIIEFIGDYPFEDQEFWGKKLTQEEAEAIQNYLLLKNSYVVDYSVTIMEGEEEFSTKYSYEVG